jgi:hypothetical protein
MPTNTISGFEFIARTAVVGSLGYIMSRIAITVYEKYTTYTSSKTQTTPDTPWNREFPTFELIVGRPDGSDTQLVHDTIRRYLDQQPIPVTCTISEATCMYNGKFPATEPCHRVLVTFNPFRVDTDSAQQVVQDLVNYLAKELNQFIVLGYEHHTTKIYKGIGNIPTE